jgi:serine/threonine protein kinase/tetratricopeptide (TPR) repeat protein
LPATAADHNLLVGVLALQLEFVARDELIDAACQAMCDGHSEPLIDTLRRRGALSEDEGDLLAALVARRLARHNNDPQQSLAHCDADGEMRKMLTALAPAESSSSSESSAGSAAIETVNAAAPGSDPHATCHDDPFLTTPGNGSGKNDGKGGPKSDVVVVSSNAPTMAYSRFEALRAAGLAPPVSGASMGSGPAASGPAPLSHPATARFRIIRPYQRGGLGQVSLARDDELNREVALKEILPKHADNDEARQRFLMEAEITGSLEHPGVVPVYGLGQYADGRPFYAMRFIRGDNMLLAIDDYHRQPDAPDRELKFRQLLARFVAVCNAIEYAHNRCVLHRDIKPGNIMLGKYGETLVVDWGLAKAIGVEAGPNDSIELPVRPLSATNSTETQMGRVVGTPAYMSPEQACGRVDILGPTTDVYSLGATLYHLLVGQAPFTYDDRDALLGNVQMGRFDSPRTLKHDVPKPLEAICLKAMERRPLDRYGSARELADDVERYLADEPTRALQESILARVGRWMRKHRAAVLGVGAVLSAIAMSLGIGVVLLGAANRRAERNFEMARNAIRDYYITVSEDTLLDQPGMQPLRNQLLRQALEYYKDFLASAQRDDSLLDELAQANFFVGRITESIESPADAIPYYQNAVAMSDRLVAKNPNDEKQLFAQARALNALGGSLQTLQRYDDSKRFYDRAEKVRQKLVDDHPENAEYVRTLANTIMNRGVIEGVSGDAKLSVKLSQKAQQLRTQRLASGQEDSKLRADTGKGDFNLGNFYLEQGDAPTAEKHLKDAVASFERVREKAPDDLDSQYLLAQCYRMLGDMQADAGQNDAAQAYYVKAFELLTTLNLRNPQVVKYKATLGAMETSAAELLLDAKKPAEALDAIEKAIAPLTELVTENAEVRLYQRDLAVALRVRAEIHLQQEARPAAASDATRAVEMLESLVAADPTDDDYAAQLEAAKTTREATN